MKDYEETQETVKRIEELLSYFEEVVLVTPSGSYFLYSMSPARCDERLYIHGIERDPEHK